MFFFKVFAGIGYAHKRHPHGHFDLFAFCCVENEPCADVVARKVASVVGVGLVFTLIRLPFGFDALHRALLFPESALFRGLVEPHHEIYRIYGLWVVVAECAQELGAFYLTAVHLAYGSAALVCEPFAEIEQDVAFAFREGEAGHA